jgi:hypothetical protein
MTATAAPFGFRPVDHVAGGIERAKVIKGGIASGYTSTIRYFDPIVVNANGTITIATPGSAFSGIFVGCEYNAVGRYGRLSRIWPANQVATDITAYIITDAGMEFEVQANGSLAATSVGDEANWVTGAGTTAGYSTAALGTLVGAGNTGDFRVVGLYEQADNNWGDAFPIVRVTMNRLAGLLPYGGAVAV